MTTTTLTPQMPIAFAPEGHAFLVQFKKSARNYNNELQFEASSAMIPITARHAGEAREIALQQYLDIEYQDRINSKTYKNCMVTVYVIVWSLKEGTMTEVLKLPLYQMNNIVYAPNQLRRGYCLTE